MGWEQLLAWVSGKVDQELRLKVEYLAAENRILRSQIRGRPRLTDGQRITLATIGKKLGMNALDDIACIVTPETILRWHRQLVAKKFDTSDRRKARTVGRPTADAAVVEQVVRLARDNPSWGYRRIAGALLAIGINLSHQTVKNILEDHGIDPAPSRKSKTSWSDFIRSHTDCLLATDFFTTEVWTAFGLVTYYALLETGIELGASAGAESGATCGQRIAPFGARSNVTSLDSHITAWLPPLVRLLPSLSDSV